MAKVEAWEQSIRDDMALFANQLNIAPSYALTVHEFERGNDPENIPKVDPDDPKLMDKLFPKARIHLLISASISYLIKGMEDGDQRGVEGMIFMAQCLSPVPPRHELGQADEDGPIVEHHGNGGPAQGPKQRGTDQQDADSCGLVPPK